MEQFGITAETGRIHDLYFISFQIFVVYNRKAIALSFMHKTHSLRMQYTDSSTSYAIFTTFFTSFLRRGPYPSI